MTPFLAFIAALAAPAAPVVWYGPTTASFSAPYIGNPYDFEDNDAWVVYRKTSGEEEKRLAYFDGGRWKSMLVARNPGDYTATFVLNGRPQGSPTHLNLTTPVKEGFVRKGGRWGFTYDSGALYWPMGHNLGWQSPEMPDMTTFLHTMAANGINWSRIWSTAWDGKNPWWPSDKTKLPIGMLWPKAIARWDEVVDAADKEDIRFQFVLFHHGQWSTTTDPNWPDNPWNTKNGGFLSNPVDFFTDPRAKKLAKEWIRYAVARWGYSRSIMAWELFNEVQWVDAVKQNHIPDVAAWHDEMAAYLRTLDPYHHLITTSSEMSLPIWSKLDYYQPHGYPARIEPMVLSAKSPDSKPLFFGEVGPGQLMGGKEIQVQAVRDGIWSGLFAHHAGAAQYWTWDLTLKDDLHREYAMASKILRESKVLDEADLLPENLSLDARAGATLVFSPGGGWEPTTKFLYRLPEDAGAGLSHLSAFFQGRGHADMRPQPVQFQFMAPADGIAVISVSGVSATGAELSVKVNGSATIARTWAAGTKLVRNENLDVPFHAGPVSIELDNQGPDWAQLASVSIPGVARNATAVGIGNGRAAVMRIERPSGSASASIRLGSTGLKDGSYTGVLTDLNTGHEQALRLSVVGGQARTRIQVAAIDSILWLRGSR